MEGYDVRAIRIGISEFCHCFFRCLGKSDFPKFENFRVSTRCIAVVLLGLGVSANIYESFVIRNFASGEQGAYGYALRQTYEWVDRKHSTRCYCPA